MYPNPQDVLPLPSRPNLDHYKKQAKELVKAFKTGTLQPRSEFEEFAIKKLTEKAALSNAQFVIARAHGFASWPKFARHIDALQQRTSVANFEAAADAIVSGNANALRKLLHEDTNLPRERSTREHRATVLHYVSANGVENFRQTTPKNIVAIAKLLLDAGADVNAEADVYEGRSTTLMLTATSVHPARAGVQLDLLQLLLDRGAEIRPRDVRHCFANGRGAAGEFLANHGAPLTFEEAAGVGRLDLVRDHAAPVDQIKHGFLWACQYGRDDVVEYMLDTGLVDLTVHDSDDQTALHHAVMGAQPGTIRLLLRRGASLAAKNVYGGTALGQARWCARNNDNAADYVPIIETLLGAGAKS